MTVEIVGRDEELAAVAGFLERDGEELAALVLAGDAGIGKSTLWLAAVDAARERGMRVLVARPTEAEQRLALTGLADLLDGVVDEVLSELTLPQRRALEVALLIEPGEMSVDPRALGVAVRSALRLLAPVVVAIDDVQWLDPASASALEFALRRVDDAGVTLLLARRGEGASIERALEQDGIARVSIGPLSVGALHGLLRNRLGRTFPRPTLVRLHEAAGGNPFYALELARGIDGAAQVLSVPETLAEVVRGRLTLLPDQTRTALLTVAASGRSTLDVLRTAGIDEQALEPALAADVIAVEEDQVRFTHPLLSSTLYGDASDAERRVVHERLAEVVIDPVARARHLILAGEGLDELIAQELEHAASVARGRGAVAVAAELVELAADRTPADAEDDARRRCLQAARDHVHSGTPETALALALDAVARADPGQPRAEALLLLGEVMLEMGKPRPAVSYLREALAEHSGVPELEIVVHGLLAWQLQHNEGLAAAETHAREALALADRVDDSLAARAHVPLAATRFLAGEADGLELTARALHVARATGDPAVVNTAAYVHGQVLLWHGRLAGARELLSECHSWAADHDEPSAVATLLFLAHVELRAGRWDRVRRYVKRLELEPQYKPEDEDRALVALRARLAAHEGDEAAAQLLADQALALSEGDVSQWQFSWDIRSLLGLIAQWTGDAGAAVEHFARIERERRAVGYGRLIAFANRARSEYVEALLQLGAPDEANGVVAGWEEDAALHECAWEAAGAVRCRGLLAAALGDREAAVALLEDSVAQHEALDDPFGRARALLSLGIVRRRARQKRAAREAIEAALAGFEALGAAGWAERGRAELGSIGGRTRSDGLSPAELRVATLVAEGKTNREVAAALFLGERTVETHLSRVYAKLGIRSRTELARTLD